MPDYSKGKIYKILNNIDDEIYVGSTTETLGQRMAKHRHSMKAKPQYKLYKHMHELDVGNFYIELIENYPCNDVYALRAREGDVIRQIATLNKQIAGRTQKERYQETIEDKKAYDIKYHASYDSIFYETKKDVINHKRRQKVACECGFMSNKANLYKHKQSSNHFSRKEQIEKEKIGV